MKISSLTAQITDRAAEADAAGYFVGRLEGEAKGDKSVQEAQVRLSEEQSDELTAQSLLTEIAHARTSVQNVPPL